VGQVGGSARSGTYRALTTTFEDREQWTLPHVLAERARTHGNRVFLDLPEDGVLWTYAQTHELAARVASRFRDHARQGDRVLIMGPNSAAYLLAWFGAALAGMVEVPINTAYRGSFLEHQVRTSSPRLAVVDADLAQRFVDSAEACRSIDRFYVTGTEPQHAVDLLRANGWAAEPFSALLEGEIAELPAMRASDLASVLFTSGTTGPSKGVMMSHAHMHFFAAECVHLTRLTDADVYYGPGPLFHGNGQFLACLPAMIVGATFTTRRRFSASRWLDTVRTSGATVTNFLGVMMDFVWKQPPTDRDTEHDLRCIFAAPTAHYVEAFQRRFGIEAFVEVFGLTETAMPIMTPYGEPRPIGAAGRLVEDWFDIRLVDPDTDEEVPVGEVGELVVRPKVPWTTTLGYYGMPERTVEAFRNLWFHTGDGLRRDEDGWYYFVDRLKDALRRRGENISSYELESPILEHPSVTEVAVVGVPADIEAGEDEVLAVIVPASGAELSAEAVWEWCEQRIPSFAIPRFVRFVDALPKTPSEKIRKGELRAAGVTADTFDRDAARSGGQG
jgi:carnitine-CoA ligase